MKMSTSRILVLLTMLMVWAPTTLASDKVVLGKLGQALSATPIYSQPNTKSRVYYRVQAYEYLVVREARNNARWLQVLLQNGDYGYVNEPSVARLPYEVTADRQPQQAQARGGTVNSRSGAALASYSMNYIGTPYVWGGNDMKKGVDCSGFVKNLVGKIAGVNLPRTAAEQVKVGKPITRLEDLQPGDRLYFWETKRNTIGHTGIYLGGGMFVHSSRGRGGVQAEPLTKRWQDILVAARR